MRTITWVTSLALLVAACGGSTQTSVDSLPLDDDLRTSTTAEPVSITEPADDGTATAFAETIAGEWYSCTGGEEELAGTCTTLSLRADRTYTWAEQSDYQHYFYEGSWGAAATEPNVGHILFDYGSVMPVRLSEEGSELQLRFGEYRMIPNPSPEPAVSENSINRKDEIRTEDVVALLTSKPRWYLTGNQPAPYISEASFNADWTFDMLTRDCVLSGRWGLRVAEGGNERGGLSTTSFVLEYIDCDAEPVVSSSSEVRVVDGEVFIRGELFSEEQSNWPYKSFRQNGSLRPALVVVTQPGPLAAGVNADLSVRLYNFSDEEMELVSLSAQMFVRQLDDEGSVISEGYEIDVASEITGSVAPGESGQWSLTITPAAANLHPQIGVSATTTSHTTSVTISNPIS